MFGFVPRFVDRAAGFARRSGGRLERLGRRAGSDAAGIVQRARHRNPPPKDLDDVTLARKVETELFRPADAPKGDVNIDVVDGVVTLRGEVKQPGQLEELERAALAIPEVRGVENLLKLRKTPSRTRANASGRSKRTGGRKPSATAGGRSTTATSGRSNRERQPGNAEGGPSEHAASRTGRATAPLGSEEPPPEETL
jgi:hypothetical protein